MTNREHAEKIVIHIENATYAEIPYHETIDKIERYLNSVWPEKEELKPDWEKLKEEFMGFGLDNSLRIFNWFKSKLT